MVREIDSDSVPAVYNLDDIPSTEVRKGVHQQIFRGMNSMMGFTRLEPAMETGPHKHPWEQIAFIYRGTCNFHIGDEILSLEKGDILVVPPNVEHYAEPNSDKPCINLDVWPLREDYLPQTDYQDEWVHYENE